MSMLSVAIQGDRASFHDIAAKKFFGEDIKTVHCGTFTDCFKGVKDSKAEYAVVAIENSLFGSINEVYDLLLKYSFWISGEVFLRVEQCLIGLPDASIQDIREVHSHPVALAQCEEFLDSKLPKAARFGHHDTAASVADVKKWNDPAKAAIAGREAAKLHGMEVLAEEIETNKQNYTRFVLLDPRKVPVDNANKTSLVLTTAHTPGALYNALGAFAKNDINLTKLQSRPIIGKPWEYMFYIDIDKGTESESWQTAAKTLKDQGCEVITLGSYKAFKRSS